MDGYCRGPKHTCIGIDPGISGGIVYLRTGQVTTYKMPTTERDIYELLGSLGHYPRRAVIEWIHPAIPGIGKSSMSKLYGNYMTLRMALIAAGIPFEGVKPRVWQKALGISPRKKTETRTRWKNRLKAKAQELFPSEKVTLAIADALLIAEYCHRLHTGSLQK